VQDLFPLLTFVGIALVFWLLLVRPQARRRRELEHMQSTLEVGDEVILTSGIFGTIRVIDEDTIRLEISDGVTIKVAQGAIGKVVSEADPEPEDAEAPGDDSRSTEEN
jgi:preprotein translocase subunit YajC